MKIKLTSTLAAAFVFAAFSGIAATPKQDCLKKVNEMYGKNRENCNKMKGGAKTGKQDCYRNASLSKTAAQKNCK